MSEIISTDPIKNIKIFEWVIYNSYEDIKVNNGFKYKYPVTIHTLENL